MPEFHPEHVPADAGGFLSGYLAAAEWLLDDEVDRGTVEGWHASAIEDAKQDCDAFEAANAEDLALYSELTGRDDESAGHDFWLSRNGHGAGFFDRGTDPVFSRLQKAARVWSGKDAYLGDDGFLYLT